MQLALYPTPDQLRALLADPSDAPVVMLNLLRFKPDGEAAYRQYATAMRAIVERAGGRFVWTGRVTAQVIGAGVEHDLGASSARARRRLRCLHRGERGTIRSRARRPRGPVT